MATPDKLNLQDLRVSYDLDVMLESNTPADPVELFQLWFNDALAHQLPEPNAMQLATATPDGTPNVRTVLLKGIDGRGFHFFTNYESNKGRELAANPRAAACFLWNERHHQVIVRGTVSKLPHEEALAYFASRPAGHQIGAWASAQSQIIPDRAWLDQRAAEIEVKFGSDVPCPPFWGGYTIQPTEIEFWQGRTSRLHDRLLYGREGGVWVKKRVSP
ncbi:MAG: pyridoxamine 5'-phosphate oxidase [Verrucomicrobiaceae bacterium]|nr:pyridoxamine 5'-phosphate oxidase [Verrucomicrobiaceae bacterium]